MVIFYAKGKIGENRFPIRIFRFYMETVGFDYLLYFCI